MKYRIGNIGTLVGSEVYGFLMLSLLSLSERSLGRGIWSEKSTKFKISAVVDPFTSS
jgi:hypothetical protein